MKILIGVEPSGFSDLCLSRIAAIIFVVFIQRSLGFPPAAELLYYMDQFRGVASMLSDDETAVAFRVSGFINSLSTSRRLETELFAASQVLAVLRAASIRLQTLLLENSFV